MANLATSLWEHDGQATCLVVHNHIAPSDTEWNHWADVLGRAIDGINLGRFSGASLAITDGGAPNTRQRAQINELLKRRTLAHPSPSAVISSHLLVRSVVLALRLFHRETRAFDPGEALRALDFAHVARAKMLGLREHVARLNAMLTPRSCTADRVLEVFEETQRG